MKLIVFKTLTISHFYKFLANLASVVLHPLLMPTFIYAVILFVYPISATHIPSNYFLTLLLIMLLTTAIMPGIAVYVLYVTGAISSISLNKRKDRLLPNLFAIAIYLSMLFLFYNKMGIKGILFYALLCMTITIAVLALITLFWKISVHTCAMGGFVGFLVGLNFHFPESKMLLPITISIFLLGGLMSARMYLNCHTSLQAWAGMTLGMTSSILSVFLMF